MENETGGELASDTTQEEEDSPPEPEHENGTVEKSESLSAAVRKSGQLSESEIVLDKGYLTVSHEDRKLGLHPKYRVPWLIHEGRRIDIALDSVENVEFNGEGLNIRLIFGMAVLPLSVAVYVATGEGAPLLADALGIGVPEGFSMGRAGLSMVRSFAQSLLSAVQLAVSSFVFFTGLYFLITGYFTKGSVFRIETATSEWVFYTEDESSVKELRDALWEQRRSNTE